MSTKDIKEQKRKILEGLDKVYEKLIEYILEGLDKVYEKLIEYKRSKNSDLVIMKKGKVVKVKPE